MIFWSNIANLHENSGISIIKSVANLKISWSFFIRKILRSTRTLDCDKYRLKSKGKFFSFCWAIFLYFSTPISWVMSYDKKCPRFVDPVRGWVKHKYEINRELKRKAQEPYEDKFSKPSNVCDIIFLFLIKLFVQRLERVLQVKRARNTKSLEFILS